jgi:hypothetical protein
VKEGSSAGTYRYLTAAKNRFYNAGNIFVCVESVDVESPYHLLEPLDSCESLITSSTSPLPSLSAAQPIHP